MPSKNDVKEDNYTPEERLTAAALEYKKLEAQNQSSIERMYGALSSPFKVSSKPCEVSRAAVLRCFEEILGKKGDGNDEGSVNPTEATAYSSSNGNGNGNAKDNGAGGVASFPPTSRFPPVHRCYDVVLQYESCVLDKALAQHHSLLVDFEARQQGEMQLAKEAEASALRGA
ncbi:hypothetical protein TraAM80_04747 [Trypanosoma rangeli]|uniref:Uncharacterized protein n=1 Tax=Trypanosoma rangeli TaxID=5698 RepID=A0A3R7KNC4_TRYRA|nr:uncharacterized protein TraAM80_04747 [Trypanosoma rangeli]RNF05175.1 hypothetical protein TraAM80_04747 [Trypanosoma rangeli]|eukprot:RNF05175.1 hypothetical protein TraAM80_04747 [Trypanosoma rangeli]